MNRALQIAVDLEQGEIRLGTESVRLLPVAGDVFCLNDARGPLVRALKFEERARLLSDVSDRDIASLVADAALVSSGVATEEIRIAASLALAGGGEEAPAFPECMQFVEQRYGWDEKRIAETMALVVDRLCGQMVQQDASIWKQIVFQKSDADLGALISQMASNLSQRAGAQKINIDPEKPQPSKRSQLPQQHASPSAHGSLQAVSSLLPVKRTPFRVLAVNTDKPTQTEIPAITSPKPSELPQALIEHNPLPLSTTSAAASLESDFPATLRQQSHHADFSLSQSGAQANCVNFSQSAAQPYRVNLSQSQAAAPAKIEQSASQSVATFPTTFPEWQPFTTSPSTTKPASEPAPTSARAFTVAAPETHTSQDWLAEVAQLLEAECDLRGIDP